MPPKKTDVLVTRRVAAHEGGAVAVSITYDDVTMLVSALDAVNNGPRGLRVVLLDPATGRGRTLDVPAGTTSSAAFPTTGNQRLSPVRLARAASTLPEGLRVETAYPWP